MLTVQFCPDPAITDIRDTDQGHDVPNGDVPNVPDNVQERRSWILQELAKGRRLKVSDIAEHFGCTEKTIQRDLNALKGDGKVEFVGVARTGYYRLV